MLEIDLTEREAPKRPAHSPAHEKALTAIRKLIGVTTPNREAWWSNLTPGERITLLRHAGLLSDENEKKRWAVFSCIEQDRILHAVARAASWAQGLRA